MLISAVPIVRQAAVKEVNKLAPETAVMFFSVDKAAGKTMCVANVPQSKVAKGLKAGAWVDEVAKVLNGKVFMTVWALRNLLYLGSAVRH